MAQCAAMKLVKCIVRPEKAEELVVKLSDFVPGLTMYEVRGHGHQKGHPVVYRGVEYEVTLVPKMTIEIAIADSRVDDVIKLVVETARSGNIGDGRIFVVPIEETYHVRTGFMDLD
jgi:nitrogen regulatory protein PII